MAPPLDIELLRTFHAIARFGQFRAASLHLNRSPSAVSTHVRRLEELSGRRLFDRDNQGVTLTPAGRSLLIQTNDFLQAHDRIVASFDTSAATGRVRFGVSEEYTRRLLRDALPLFSAEHPGVELEVETGSSGDLASRLERGSLDLALVVQPTGQPREPGRRHFGTTQPVWVAGFGFVLPADMPVPLALHGSGCPYRSAAVDALAAIGRSWRTVVTSSGSAAIEAAIEGGFAVGILDRARVTDAMRILGQDEGLPALPAYDLVIAQAAGSASKAQDLLAQTIIRHFRL
ncbi:LysR family transcriptional regulator (plasmid) [Skermanella mucosa]|uniref:LysR substrate-binding domain-containing protein n=1 Tax=Skermanella mucosa TaxID=1789672 RepID=UPI00192C2222|nr:LysR substrate-binding domain-containing protein [Skermanella mucosa]UEM24855.1 LysR family transcriptional regulator [Skermanella mucosa]